MGLAAVWRRQGAWATGVTFLVPGVLALAVCTALLGGGFRGLGAIGQVFTGPQVPEARLAASTVPARPHAAGLPTVPVLRPGGAVLGTRPVGPAAPFPAGPAAPRRPVAAAPPRRTATPAGPAAATAPAAQPMPPAGRPVSPLRQAGEQAAGAVGQAPVIGPAGHDAVTSVLDVVAPPSPVALPVP
jgi:hypothetical protein